MSRLKTAMVLGGGAARGAYEAGVISYLRDELEPKLGQPLRFDIFAGTSVGAIHACYLAATNDQPSTQGQRMVPYWQGMRVDEVLNFGLGDILRLVRETFGKPSAGPVPERYGGLVDPRGLRILVGQNLPWLQIGRNIRSGAVAALSVSATHVATGHITSFVQRHGGGTPPWSKDPHYHARAVRIGPKHALASASIPILFPAVRLGGRLYVDGGLRLNVPLSPALRLGAQRVVVISLRHDERAGGKPQPPPHEGEQPYATAPFLFGKTLNAFLLDRTDQDLDRLERLNSILEAGTRSYGPSFAKTINDALVPHRNQRVRYVRTLLVRPSEDIGRLAAEYARSAMFRQRSKSLAHRTILRLLDREATNEADLASYLLFDGGFADILINLGRSDARKHEEEWARFWSDQPACDAEAAQRDLEDRAD